MLLDSGKKDCLDFEKAKELIEHLEDVRPEDQDEVFATLLYKISESNTLQVILTEVTGVDLMDAKSLYNYLGTYLPNNRTMVSLLAKAHLVDEFKEFAKGVE
jgi:hypothetical protein